MDIPSLFHFRNSFTFTITRALFSTSTHNVSNSLSPWYLLLFFTMSFAIYKSCILDFSFLFSLNCHTHIFPLGTKHEINNEDRSRICDTECNFKCSYGSQVPASTHDEVWPHCRTRKNQLWYVRSHPARAIPLHEGTSRHDREVRDSYMAGWKYAEVWGYRFGHT